MHRFKKNINMITINKFWSIFLTLTFTTLLSCDTTKNEQEVSPNNASSINKDTVIINKNLLTDFKAIFEDGDINVVVEIPAGTTEKWEVEKKHGTLKLEQINNKPRIINYLGYPGNYGMVPQTLLPKELGGDGDPLDVIVLGKPAKRGTVIKCKLIGVLYLLDRGEQDDKLIAVMEGTPLYHINDIEELKQEYEGITNIIETWFSNYKGIGKMKANGFGEKEKAKEILINSIKAYKAKHNKQ